MYYKHTILTWDFYIELFFPVWVQLLSKAVQPLCQFQWFLAQLISTSPLSCTNWLSVLIISTGESSNHFRWHQSGKEQQRHEPPSVLEAPWKSNTSILRYTIKYIYGYNKKYWGFLEITLLESYICIGDWIFFKPQSPLPRLGKRTVCFFSF